MTNPYMTNPYTQPVAERRAKQRVRDLQAAMTLCTAAMRLNASRKNKEQQGLPSTTFVLKDSNAATE